MKNLIAQIVKFGFVGGISFVIDWGVLNLLMWAVHMPATVAGTISFLISLVFNYLASMKYVFTHRDDMAKWMEMAIFLISAVIGLIVNDLILWVATGPLLPAGITQATHAGTYTLYANIGKLVATVVVSVWNFVIRKWLLDAPAKGKTASPAAVALGLWSLEHTPKGWPR